MKPAQAMISRFGGQTALAEALHTKQSTVQYWAKIGNIPAKWHKPLIEAAWNLSLVLRLFASRY